MDPNQDNSFQRMTVRQCRNVLRRCPDDILQSNIMFSVNKDHRSGDDRPSAVIKVIKGENICISLKTELRSGLQSANVHWTDAVDTDVKRIVDLLESISENIYSATCEKNVTYIQNFHQDVSELTKTSGKYTQSQHDLISEL